MVQVNGKRSGSFTIKQSVRQGHLLSHLLYVLALELFIRKLRDEKANPALIGVPLVGRVRVRVCAFADDITVFESCGLGIKAVKKAVSILTRPKVYD